MTSDYDDVKFRNLEFGILDNSGNRDGITLAGACTVAAFVVVFAVIGALHATTGENGNPVIRFEATRDSNETNVRWLKHELPGEIHFVTFDDISTNDGRGMGRDGSFFAPVGGLYCFTFWGVFRRYMVDDYVAMAVFRRETTWPTVNPLVAYVAVDKTEVFGKTRFVGGTIVERLSVGDRIRIAQQGNRSQFVYSGDGGSALSFRGELIAGTGAWW